MSVTRGVGDVRLRALILGLAYHCGPTMAGPGCGVLVAPGHCHLCHGPGATSIDHLLPVVRGGTSAPDNLRPAHHTCNSARGARMRPPAAAVVLPW